MSRNNGNGTEKAPLPSNIEAEKCILGAILIDNSAIGAALKQINSGDFSRLEHQKIFRHMLQMQEAGEPIDLVTLCEKLGATKEIEGVGGAAYIASLTDGVPRSANTEEYAKIVRQKSRLRSIIHLSDNVQKLAFSPEADVETIRAKLQGGVLDETPLKTNGNGRPLTYSLPDFMQAEFPVPEHLVEGLIPRAGTVMIVAMPHHLKSWFTTSLALATSVAGIALGKLEVKKPVRTILVQMEDFPGILQGRMRELLLKGFKNCNPENVRIFPRCDFFLPDNAWYQRLLHEVKSHKADHIILDVVRRIFRGDINSQKETIPFLEQLDRLREETGVTTTLVHHENRKEADLMYASAGSYTRPSWAHVLIQFKRKIMEGAISHVEIEADNKLAQAPEPMRMVLDLSSDTPIRLDSLEDTAGVQDLRDQLGEDFTVRDIQEVLSVAKTSAMRRVKKMIAAGIIEKLTTGKRGRAGGLARYHWCETIIPNVDRYGKDPVN